MLSSALIPELYSARSWRILPDLDLIERCAVIMSFDAYTMHKLRPDLDELDAWLDAE